MSHYSAAEDGKSRCGAGPVGNRDAGLSLAGTKRLARDTPTFSLPHHTIRYNHCRACAAAARRRAEPEVGVRCLPGAPAGRALPLCGRDRDDRHRGAGLPSAAGEPHHGGIDVPASGTRGRQPLGLDHRHHDGGHRRPGVQLLLPAAGAHVHRLRSAKLDCLAGVSSQRDSGQPAVGARVAAKPRMLPAAARKSSASTSSASSCWPQKT